MIIGIVYIFVIAGHFGTGKTVIGTESVKIKRARYIEAGQKVQVHVFIRGTFLSELQTYLKSMLSDLDAIVSLIHQGKSALLKAVNKLIEG